MGWVAVQESAGGREDGGIGAFVTLCVAVGGVWCFCELVGVGCCWGFGGCLLLFGGERWTDGCGIDLWRVAGEEILEALGEFAHQAGGGGHGERIGVVMLGLLMLISF